MVKDLFAKENWPSVQVKVKRRRDKWHQGLTRPSRNRLSAVATMISSLPRGVQPSSRLAFAPDKRLILPSCGAAARSKGTPNAASRTSQLGASKRGVREPAAPSLV